MELQMPIVAKPVDTNWIGNRLMFVPKDGSNFDKSKAVPSGLPLMGQGHG
jgi:hypothetical protein